MSRTFERVAFAHFTEGIVVAADDLLSGGFSADLVVADAVAVHVDAHISGRFVRGLSVNLVKDRVQKREHFHIPVIVDAGLSVSFQMEGVDHVDIIEVRGGSLIGEVDRVAERQVPDREGLEFRIAGFNATAVLMIEL